MKKIILFISVVITMGFVSISATQYYKAEYVKNNTDSLKVSDSLIKETTTTQTYKASFYGKQFHGKKTASGEIYDIEKLTAAHKKLPFGTKVKITNVNNDKSVIVTVNDRGPFVKQREFDLSTAAFESIADKNAGVIKISYEIL